MGGLQFFMQAAASLSLSEVANAIKGAPFFLLLVEIIFCSTAFRGKHSRKLFGRVSYPLQLFNAFHLVTLAG